MYGQSHRAALSAAMESIRAAEGGFVPRALGPAYGGGAGKRAREDDFPVGRSVSD